MTALLNLSRLQCSVTLGSVFGKLFSSCDPMLLCFSWCLSSFSGAFEVVNNVLQVKLYLLDSDNRWVIRGLCFPVYCLVAKSRLALLQPHGLVHQTPLSIGFYIFLRSLQAHSGCNLLLSLEEMSCSFLSFSDYAWVKKAPPISCSYRKSF